MTVAAALTLSGLVLDIAGAILVYRHNVPPGTLWDVPTEKREHSVRWGRRGLMLLIIGFTFQGIAVLITSGALSSLGLATLTH